MSDRRAEAWTRAWVVGVVRQVHWVTGGRGTAMVVDTDDGLVMRGCVPSAFRNVAPLVGRRVRFHAYVDGGRYRFPSRAVVDGGLRWELTRFRGSRLTLNGETGGLAVEVAVVVRDLGDAVVVLPVEVARALWAALNTDVVQRVRRSG